jgi:hypothetical protein
LHKTVSEGLLYLPKFSQVIKAIFCDIVHRAAPQITACIKDDPDDDVQVAAMVTLSQLSREGVPGIPFAHLGINRDFRGIPVPCF